MERSRILVCRSEGWGFGQIPSIADVLGETVAGLSFGLKYLLDCGQVTMAVGP